MLTFYKPGEPPVAKRLTGIDVQEEAGAEQSIARAPTGITAFVGRTLRGPVNRPVVLHSLADFQRTFGGLWQPSTLSYAVEQFFECGGTDAIVVRVANGALPCTISLPARGGCFTLRAVAPGTREFLRAAVDYDGIGDNEQDRFNLVLQRVRAPASEHIEDQEIYRRLSVDETSSRFVADALTESQLVRVSGPVPAARPSETHVARGQGLAAYVRANPDGDDGGALSDYDIIGSAARGTGLFALASVESFNFLCIPPLTRDMDIGPSALLVANRYCNDRRAILIVDPPHEWDTPAAALEGVRDWAFSSDGAIMYFPRLLAHDKLRGRFEAFAPCGAVAGMLSRTDTRRPVWATSSAAEDAVLRPGMRSLCPVGVEEREKLAAAGINVMHSIRPALGGALDARTLAGPGAACADWRLLANRRLALFILNSVERGTRWMLFEPNGPALWGKAGRQLRGFFGTLEAEGAFAERAPDDRWFVICDERVNRPLERDRGMINLLFGFAAARAGQFHTYLVSHQAGGSRLRRVTLNRLQNGARRPDMLDEAEVAPVLEAL
jgi:phage tail sheath protein FI